MDTSNLKNIVVLKDLPSNLIEEAIVVLKENQKIPKLELVDKDVKNVKHKTSQTNHLDKQNPKDYIIKEAQLLISEYISRIENKNRKETPSFQALKKKCKRLKIVNSGLIISIALMSILGFIL